MQKLETCEKCGFTYSAEHAFDDGSYECPVCNETFLQTRISDLQTILDSATARVFFLEDTLGELFAEVFSDETFFGNDISLDILPILQSHGFVEEVAYDPEKHRDLNLDGMYEAGDFFWLFTEEFNRLREAWKKRREAERSSSNDPDARNENRRRP